MSKKLYIKKNNHLLTLLDEEDIQDKIDENVPTKTSDLTNDSGFLTSHQDISGKENKANKTTTLSSSSTNTQYPSAKAVYDAIQAIPSIDMIEITSNKGTASASTMDKFYIEVSNNKRDVYYTEENNSSYSWHKLDTDVLDDLSIDWSDIDNKPTIPTKTSDLTNDGDGTNIFVKNNDSRLTDARAPIIQVVNSKSNLGDGIFIYEGD